MSIMTSGMTRQEEISELLEEITAIIEDEFGGYLTDAPFSKFVDLKNTLCSYLEHKVLGFGLNYVDSIYDECIAALSPTCQADWDEPITHRQAVDLIEGVREQQ